MHPFYENNSHPIRFMPTTAGEFPEHLHAQVELLYLYSGEAVMTIDGQEYTLHTGDLALCFSGVVHGYVRSCDAGAMMIIFSPSISTDFSTTLTRHAPVCPLLKKEELPGDVARCMDAIREECAGAHDERALRGYLQVVLARALPLFRLTDQPPEAPDVAYRILQYLALHFTEPISLPKLSRALGVSESHLSHTFSRRFKTGFRAYVNTLRMDYARTLLSTTEGSITQILYECGFESPRTFNRAFAERYGVTPSAYRREHSTIQNQNAGKSSRTKKHSGD